MNPNEFSRAMVEALGVSGLPLTKLVLTLEVGQLPTLQLDMRLLGQKGTLEIDDGAPGRIKSLPFMLRLQPFED
jgi:hypothetical protein